MKHQIRDQALVVRSAAPFTVHSSKYVQHVYEKSSVYNNINNDHSKKNNYLCNTFQNTKVLYNDNNK